MRFLWLLLGGHDPAGLEGSLNAIQARCIQNCDPQGPSLEGFLDLFVTNQGANLIYRTASETGIGRGCLNLGALGRRGDICELLSINYRRSRINDERHPARPGCPWVPPSMIRTPLDDGVTGAFEVCLGTIRENQDDLSGYCNITVNW